MTTASGDGMARRLAGLVKRLLRRRSRGAVALELVLLAPVTVLIMFGAVDLVLYLRAQVKLETAAVQVGQILSQCSELTSPGDVSGIWGIATTSLNGVGTVSASSGSVMIVSGVTNVGGANRVAWQVRSKSGTTSIVGTTGGAATIPAGYIVPAGQVLITTEVASPITQWVLSNILLHTGIVPNTLSAATYFLSRTPDPTVMSAAPTTNANRKCLV